MSNFSYYCMECGSPTTEFKPKFCPSCGKPFFQSSNSSSKPIVPSTIKPSKKEEPPDILDEDDDDDFIEDNNNPTIIENASDSFDLQDLERKRVTLKDLEHQEKIGSVRDPIKKVSKKQALEEFKKEASASSRVNKR